MEKHVAGAGPCHSTRRLSSFRQQAGSTGRVLRTRRLTKSLGIKVRPMQERMSCPVFLLVSEIRPTVMPPEFRHEHLIETMQVTVLGLKPVVS